MTFKYKRNAGSTSPHSLKVLPDRPRCVSSCQFGCKNMLGYLSLVIICSSRFTVFLKLRSRKTVCFSEQIMSADKYPSIFSRQMKAIVYISAVRFDIRRLILFQRNDCLLYTSPSPRDLSTSRMPSSA